MERPLAPSDHEQITDNQRRMFWQSRQVPFRVRALSALGAVVSLLSTSAAEIAPSSAGDSFFEQKIRPVLAEHCYKCHSAKESKFKGGLALDSKMRALQGGDTGPAIVPSKPEASLLLTAIRHADPDLEMPPKEKLPDEVIANFEKWIKAGAPFPAGAAEVTELKPWWELIRAEKFRAPNQTVGEVVDHYVTAKLQDAKVQPASAASDANFIRRVTLDLAGRIPTPGEVRDYESSTERNKKQQLVDRLMASPAFERQQVAELDWLLMDGKGGPFREYLTRAVKEKRGWDKIFREVMTADATNSATKGTEQFIKTRVANQDRLANDVSVRFFGVNISCAQCHDHPQVLSWKQDHYYGMKAFFNRTFENGDFLGERDYGQVSFKPKRGNTKRAPLMFITGEVMTEPESAEPDGNAKKAEKALLEEAKKNKVPPPAPQFSRRAQLVEAGLKQGENGYFARAIVNQVWARFFGHGLVMPVDQMHGQNAPSHPELLAWLARELVRRDYDLRGLVRGLVLSEAYARSSQWSGSPRPDAALYAVAVPRALTPRQFGTSLQIATARGAAFTNQAELETTVERMEKDGNSWASSFERPSFDFQVSVEEALMFSNSDKVEKELLKEDRLLRDLLGASDSEKMIRAAYQQVLFRAPQPDEMKALRHYVEQRSDRPTDAIRQVVWAMMTSTEFRFNY
jgi:hypothetical protein